MFDENVSFKEMMENLCEDELTMLVEYEEEISRTGGFELIFPKSSNIGTYEKYFSSLRQNNQLLWKYLRCGKVKLLEKYYNKMVEEKK
jgi:hypothetical protein